MFDNTLFSNVPIGELPQFFVPPVPEMFCPFENTPHEVLVWFL